MSAQPGEYIYDVAPIVFEDDNDLVVSHWRNRPAGARNPGPYGYPGQRTTGGTGFLAGFPTPQLEFNLPSDTCSTFYISECPPFWAVSQTVWEWLLKVDANAFSGVETRSVFADGVQGPRVWLVDVVQWRYALNVRRSIEAGVMTVDGTDRIRMNSTQKEVTFVDSAKIGGAKFFRIPTYDLSVFCVEQVAATIQSLPWNKCVALAPTARVV